MENDFLAMKEFCPWLDTHFPFISQANMYLSRIGKKFLSGQKTFCPGRWTGHKSAFPPSVL